MTTKLWPRIVRTLGGIYDLGPLCIAVTDQGLTIAWRQVCRMDWRVQMKGPTNA